jgi:hypothetical protein
MCGETGVREILFRWSDVDPTDETGETHGGQTGIMENNMSLTPVFLDPGFSKLRFLAEGAVAAGFVPDL